MSAAANVEISFPIENKRNDKSNLNFGSVTFVLLLWTSVKLLFLAKSAILGLKTGNATFGKILRQKSNFLRKKDKNV